MTPPRRLTILTLLLLGYGVMVLTVAGLGWVTTRSLHQVQTMTDDLYVHPFVVSNAAASLKGSLFLLRDNMVLITLMEDPTESLGALEQDAQAYAQQIQSELAVINAYFLGEMNRVREFEAQLAHWHRLRAEILAAHRAGQRDTAERLLQTVGTEHFNRLIPLVDYISTFAKEKARDLVEQANQTSRDLRSNVRTLVVLLMILVFLTAALVIWRVQFLQQELARQATTDVLTGLANRRSFMAFVDRELERSTRYQTAFALAVVDLDWFKTVNDTYGHQVGDEVLKNFCAVCQQTVRATDIVGRIGGEEFAILFPNTTIPAAREVLERVRATVEQTEMARPQGSSVHITASFGLTAFVSHRTELDLLFKHADEALYQAKARGRNRVCSGDT